MRDTPCSPLQLREVFHLEFLRWLVRQIKTDNYVLKGGVNMRFFFGSMRYSEDMDLDAAGIPVERLKTSVMKILSSEPFHEALTTFGIRQIVLPNMGKAKQTDTTQRFKVHLISEQGTDFLTKIEFSRRGFDKDIRVDQVSDPILRAYKLPPLIVPHYGIASAISQKIDALASRVVSQARDVFDLYQLSTQYDASEKKALDIGETGSRAAVSNVYDISFARFRDTVLAYLSAEDQPVYDSPERWDDIRVRVVDFIKEVSASHV